MNSNIELAMNLLSRLADAHTDAEYAETKKEYDKIPQADKDAACLERFAISQSHRVSGLCKGSQ